MLEVHIDDTVATFIERVGGDRDTSTIKCTSLGKICWIDFIAVQVFAVAII